MTVEVRDLRAADKAQWLPLWRGYLDFYKAEFSAEQADLTFARLLDPAEPMFGLVAQSGADEVSGIANCILHRTTWAPTHSCYLQDLFAAPDARAKGVGRALIEAIYARADEEGWARVHWLTEETNQTARYLYDRVAVRSGFIQYRR